MRPPLFHIDFSLSLLVDDVFPNVVMAKGCTLHCDCNNLIRSYNKLLNQLCDRHQMIRNLLEIRKSLPLLTTSEFLMLLSKWNEEVKDYMKLTENQCQTFKDNHIKWSLKFGV